MSRKGGDGDSGAIGELVVGEACSQSVKSGGSESGIGELVNVAERERSQSRAALVVDMVGREMSLSQNLVFFNETVHGPFSDIFTRYTTPDKLVGLLHISAHFGHHSTQTRHRDPLISFI